MGFAIVKNPKNYYVTWKDPATMTRRKTGLMTRDKAEKTAEMLRMYRSRVDPQVRKI